LLIQVSYFHFGKILKIEDEEIVVILVASEIILQADQNLKSYLLVSLVDLIDLFNQPFLIDLKLL